MNLPKHLVATETAIFDFYGEEPEILLIKRGCEPYKGMWAMPGGFLEDDELIEEGASREVFEETGVSLEADDLRHARTLVRRGDRAQQTIIVAYSAVIDKHEWKIQAGDDAEEVAWYVMDELPELAANHREIIFEAFGEIYYDKR